MRIVRHALCTATLFAALLLTAGPAQADELVAPLAGGRTPATAGTDDGGQAHCDNTIWG